MEKDIKLKDIPTNYFMATLWAFFFIMMFILLGTDIVANIALRGTCQKALGADLFYMCSQGCREIKKELDPTLFYGEVEWGLGCEIPEDVMGKLRDPGGYGPAVPLLDIKEVYTNKTQENLGH